VLTDPLEIIDSNCYRVPGPAAERLEAKKPVAATLL